VARLLTRLPGRHGPERRKDILAQALRLFGLHGVHRVTTRQIAAAVGISQPSLYAFFPTRQALVEEVGVQAFEALTDRLNAAWDQYDGLERILQMGRVYVAFGLEQPDAYRVAFMIEEPGALADATDNLALMAGLQAYNVNRLAVADHLGPDRSELDIDLMAQSLWAGMHGLVSLLIARPGFPWTGREALIDHHLRHLMAGLSSRRAEV
jgi:AcrR family transcriptional regulator